MTKQELITKIIKLEPMTGLYGTKFKTCGAMRKHYMNTILHDLSEWDEPILEKYLLILDGLVEE